MEGDVIRFAAKMISDRWIGVVLFGMGITGYVGVKPGSTTGRSYFILFFLMVSSDYRELLIHM